MKAVWKFLFPPSKWARCQPMTEAERLALYELRMGQHKAEQRMRAARVSQVIDNRATVRPAIKPKLPSDNVIQLRRKRVA